ncbi:MAG: epoxyqueuosine reductase QueH [Candidatus Helarchaeota archaeon]|nr:epoxyqueuosine reductase QueH [Candidatus Helarchaeota archaeon]
MKSILLHVCCGPCATHSIIELQRESFDVTLYFSNSNIHPKEEYIKRLDSLKDYVKKVNVPLIVDNYNPEEWFELIKGCEGDPEGGKRCQICIKTRLKKTVQYAKTHEFEWFTTTLTISPHKNTKMINQLGMQLAEEYSIKFLLKNFKKKDGFKKSIEISRYHNIYRQNYCGCIFSAKE